MGNNLCKERVARAENSKSPIDRLLGRCAQICPAHEPKANYWQKHVLETGTPTRNQPKAGNGWRQSTLTVPSELNVKGLGKDGPVAPPRRKRSSMLSPPERRPGGFKDLFGNNMSRRASVDSLERPPFTDREREALQQRRRSKSFSNLSIDRYSTPERNSSPEKNSSPERTINVIRNSIEKKYRITNYKPSTESNKTENRLQRKVSKVGNKKSDKFFGENLSDCLSDEPISPDSAADPDLKHLQKIELIKEPIKLPLAISQDKLDIFIEKNVPTANPKTIVAENTVRRPPISVEHEITLSTKLNQSPETSDIDMDIEVDDKDEHKTNLDRKAEFLMAMLDDESLYKEIPKSPVVAVAPPRRRQSKDKSATKEEPVDEGYDTVDRFEKKSTEKLFKTRADDYDDEEYYKGMSPVVEPIIVPKRKITKHICDDDDHMHKHIHSHHAHSHKESPVKTTDITQIKSESPSKAIEVAKNDQLVPVKPKRDFNVHEKTVIVSKLDIPAKATDTESATKPEIRPRTRHYSQENLATAPSTVETKTTVDFQRIHSSPAQPNVSINKKVTKGPDGEEKLESILKKCKSSQSFLTQDLMNQIVERVYGFQDPYSIDHSYDDGSSKVSPSSKLTTRKISRKESTVTPIKEDQLEESKPQTKEAPVPAAITPRATDKNAEQKKKEEIDYKICRENTIKLLDSERLHAYPWDSLAANRGINKLIIKDFTNALINTEKLNAYPNDLRAENKKEITSFKISRDATIELIDNEKENAELKANNDIIVPVSQKILNESFVSAIEPTNEVYYITMKEATRNFLDQERIHAYLGHSAIPHTINFLYLERLHSHPGHHRAPKRLNTSPVKENGVAHLAEGIQKLLQSENIDDETITHVLNDIYTSNSTILDDFQDFLSENMTTRDGDSHKKKIEVSTDNGNGSTTIIKIKQKQDTQKEPESKVLNRNSVKKIGGNRIAIALGDGERRDSIVEVDQWFLRHNDLSNRPRRGSESQVGYDTRKIFPFGKLDKSHTGASEFFENKTLSKSADDVNEDSELNLETTNIAGDRNSIGHSTLLKYLK